MTYRIALPEGGRLTTLDLIEPNSSAVQRFLRRHGLAGYEPSTVAALLAAFEHAGPGFTFVDVGANIGLYSLLCAALFEPGGVLALEPTPDIADLAERLAAANSLDIDVRRVAASKRSGTAMLNVADTSDVSNSLESGFKASAHSLSVPTMTLDHMMLGAEIAPGVIKIDVEGHESAVLQGARRVLEEHRPVLVVEVLNRRRGRLAGAIAEQLDGLGYHCYELTPSPDWVRHGQPIARNAHRDWLLVPAPLGDDFIASWSTWRDRVSVCTPDRNSRVPLVRTAQAALRRGGLQEVISAAKRFLRR
ncbi:MAG: FkbM family methyltransferase [Ilumatobacter sp.]